MKEIMVSISCITYNHESFIADALESFLMQNTNFRFEVLIHDDASTDNTQNIIREYQNRYPDIIKPIYQKENQFSKGEKIFNKNIARAKGKYVALCEGDDYWTDPFKLQKQVDYMEENPECSLCVHGTRRVTPEKKIMKHYIRPATFNKIISSEDIIMEDKEGYFHTTSFLFRSELVEDLPYFYLSAPVGDYPLAIYLSLRGHVYYIDQFMSNYRINTSGSWTSRVALNKEMFLKFVEEIFTMLDEVNKYTEFIYDDSVKEAKKMYNFRRLLVRGCYAEAKKEEYKKFFSRLDSVDKFKITVKKNFPVIEKLIKAIKGNFILIKLFKYCR